MEEFDETEVIRGSELRENADQAALRFLRGGYTRLVQTTAILTEKSDSMEATLQELQKTLSLLSKQLGKQPIAAESSHLPPQVTRSDPSIRDDSNRLPLDNWKSLLRKIEMPKFDGSNAYDWLSKVERFFRVGRYSDYDKLDLVALSLEGDVLKWFNWEMMRREFLSWEDFRRRLFSRFGAAPEESPGNRLFAIKQTGTISAYVTQFEELSAQVIGLDDTHLEQIFYNGLKPEMKEVLKLKEPVGLENQKTAVLRMETSSFCNILSDKPDKLWETQKSFTSKPVTTYAQTTPLLLQNGDNHNTSQSALIPAAKPPAIQPRQRHTAEELDAMRSKGICFKCKGKYTRGHVCPLKELQILTVVKGVELEVLDEDYTDAELLVNAQAPVLGCLSLNSFLGRHSPKTIKLMGLIGKDEVLIMIDSGASHNFITPSVASKLRLKVSSDTNLEVLLGNGTSVHGSGTCRNVQFQLSGVQFQSDFVSLELGNVDIILGMQWLETLGPCLVDWKKQEWSFVYNGKQVKLVGDTSLHTPPLLLQPLEVSDKPLCLLQEQREVTMAQLFFKDKPMLLEVSTTHSAVEFSVRDWFFLTFQLYRHLSVVLRLNHKLAAKYFGPFQVLGRVGMVAYRLQLPPGSKIHNVFHVSQLKAVLGDHHQVQSTVPPELLEEAIWFPETILDVRFDEMGRREFLVKWQDHDPSETSWMLSKDFVRLYPTFTLEDKLVLREGSIDTVHQTYFRKKKEQLPAQLDDVATESVQMKALESKGGFAVSSLENSK